MSSRIKTMIDHTDEISSTDSPEKAISMYTEKKQPVI
jgi:hypothetical protein